MSIISRPRPGDRSCEPSGQCVPLNMEVCKHLKNHLTKALRKVLSAPPPHTHTSALSLEGKWEQHFFRTGREQGASPSTD